MNSVQKFLEKKPNARQLLNFRVVNGPFAPTLEEERAIFKKANPTAIDEKLWNIKIKNNESKRTGI